MLLLFIRNEIDFKINYRPISATSVVVKIIETIIRGSLIKFLTRFCVNDWSVSLENKKAVNVIHVDLSKEFGEVHYKLRLPKHNDNRRELLEWFEHFPSSVLEYISHNPKSDKDQQHRFTYGLSPQNRRLTFEAISKGNEFTESFNGCGQFHGKTNVFNF